MRIYWCPGMEADNNLLLEETTLPSQNPWLMGYHLVKGKEEIVLASTAADALVATQHLSIPALCTPAGKWHVARSTFTRFTVNLTRVSLGIMHLPQATLAYLESFRKITLWLDNGTQGNFIIYQFKLLLSFNNSICKSTSRLGIGASIC